MKGGLLQHGDFVHGVRKIDGRREEGWIHSIEKPPERKHFHVTIRLKNGGGLFTFCLNWGDHVSKVWP